MTSTNRASGGVPAAEASVESEPWHNDWDPGSYLDAVREDLASAFATAPSLPPAVQGTNPIAKPLRIQETPRSTPGRTSIHGRPIILRNLDKHSSSLLTQEETSHLLRSLTQRDVAILQALHDYRYLNTLQIQQLFFRHSPWSYIRRAKDARDHCWHVTHDLEANGFFVDLALAGRMQVDQGLLLWIGEESSRSSRRTWAKAHRRPIATPDGEGLYLSRERTITFDLEWDRGTESIGRLRSKLRTYVGFYEDTKGADREHVLFVLHRTSREELFHRLARELFLTGRHCCRFWTTTVERIDHVGPLGPLWAPVEGPDAGEDDDEELVEPKPIDLKRLRRRRLTDLPARETSDRTIADCIGRDNWWVRRPGGGEVA